MTITPITNGESGSSVRTSLNDVIDVINGDAAASDVIGVPLTTGITGTLGVAHGGTGAATLTAHGVVMGEGTSAVHVSAAGTAGQAFLSGGASADGAYAALDVSTAAVTGVLAVANGGMGAGTHTIHGVLLGATTGAIVATAAGTAGQVFQSGGAGADGAYAALNLATAASITGVLPLANGGTGASAPISAAKTYDPASLLTLTQDVTTITSVTGALVGDFVMVSFSLDLAGLTLTGYVSAADTVTVVFWNGTNGTVNLSSGTLAARIFHKT